MNWFHLRNQKGDSKTMYGPPQLFRSLLECAVRLHFLLPLQLDIIKSLNSYKLEQTQVIYVHPRLVDYNSQGQPSTHLPPILTHYLLTRRQVIVTGDQKRRVERNRAWITPSWPNTSYRLSCKKNFNLACVWTGNTGRERVYSQQIHSFSEYKIEGPKVFEQYSLA